MCFLLVSFLFFFFPFFLFFFCMTKRNHSLLHHFVQFSAAFYVFFPYASFIFLGKPLSICWKRKNTLDIITHMHIYICMSNICTFVLSVWLHSFCSAVLYSILFWILSFRTFPVLKLSLAGVLAFRSAVLFMCKFSICFHPRLPSLPSLWCFVICVFCCWVANKAKKKMTTTARMVV